jgi:NAD(P)-dependent dehydrogenase (short-subunit alcohol dehydrogenase family)
MSSSTGDLAEFRRVIDLNVSTPLALVHHYGQAMRSRRRGGIVLVGSLAGYRDGIAVAYYGPFWAMRAALPHMRSRGWGRVINVCSLNGVNAHMGTLDYNAAKEALRALTRTAAREWAPFGVTVNAICPAAKSAAFTRALGGNPDIAAFADAMNPMGRIGDPYLDIAPVAVFLAGEGCRYLTGNTLFVDGGSHINGVAWTPDLDAAP